MATRGYQRGRTRRAKAELVDIQVGDPTAVRDELDLGSMALQDDDAVAITGGSITSTDLRTNHDLVLSDNAGYGIRLNVDSPQFGWQDLLGEVRVETTAGATNVPALTTYASSMIKQYKFSAGDSVQNTYHVPHDILTGSTAHFYLHVHWSHDSATVSTTGQVTWDVYATYAKGHNRGSFATPVNNQVSGYSSTVQRQHIINEIQISGSAGSTALLATTDLEPDGLILVTTKLNATSLSGGELPFLHYVDIHYQSIGVGTIDKAPPFYSITRVELGSSAGSGAYAEGAADVAVPMSAAGTGEGTLESTIPGMASVYSGAGSSGALVGGADLLTGMSADGIATATFQATAST